MGDTTVKKIDSKFSPKGDMGQKYLASGKHVSMRLWEKEAPSNGDRKSDSKREYETVGYVISGKATLHCEGQTISLEPGNSWTVPANADHHYEILEEFTAVEATSPPAEVHGRDEACNEKELGEITLNFQAGS
ncbi:MAG TPA: cupin domain-containing protein [Candidatus Melainabacteria bacterium]|nr:cupin domain-containing protein [Candidatus Melainabacteria bacterium]